MRFVYVLLTIGSFSSLTSADERSSKRLLGWLPFSPSGSPNSTVLNINNISTCIRNDGWSARDPFTGYPGLSFPHGVVNAIFQDGWMWGSNTNRATRPIQIGGQYYGVGTLGGRVLSPGVAEDPNGPTVRIYRIRKDYATANLLRDAADLNRVPLAQVTQQMTDSVRAQYRRDWDEWPWQSGAPFYDGNGNGVKEPGEPPGIANANQVIWFVANDLQRSQLGFYDCYGTGLEMQVTLWAYDSDTLWSNVFFKRLRLIYKGRNPFDSTLTNMHILTWSDPDLGDMSDDFAGCDTLLDLGYVYNGRASDAVYSSFGHPPPAVGYALVQGPTIITNNLADTAIYDMRKIAGARNLRMMSFSYFAAGDPYAQPPPGVYEGARQWYRIMQGLPPIPPSPPDPPFRRDPVSGQPTKYWLSGDPLTCSGWIDGLVAAPGDRQFQLATGPFTMAIGDTQEIVVALIAAMGSDNLNSVALMKSHARTVEEVYRNLLVNVPPPSPPSVPLGYALLSNYPNPFNAGTVIPFTLSDYCHVRIRIYDMLGKEVTTIVDGVRPPGQWTATWEGKGMASGVYFDRIEITTLGLPGGAFTQVRKMILLR